MKEGQTLESHNVVSNDVQSPSTPSAGASGVSPITDLTPEQTVPVRGALVPESSVQEASTASGSSVQGAPVSDELVSELSGVVGAAENSQGTEIAIPGAGTMRTDIPTSAAPAIETSTTEIPATGIPAPESQKRASVSPVRQAPFRRPTRQTKWIIIALAVVSVVIVGVILYLVFSSVGRTENAGGDVGTSESADDYEITPEAAERNVLVRELYRLAAEENPSEDPNLEKKLEQWVDDTEVEYGEYSLQGTDANMMLASYYFYAVDKNTAYNFMKEYIQAADNNSAVVMAYREYYDLATIADSLDLRISILEKMLAIPNENVNVPNENWTDVKPYYEQLLNELYAKRDAKQKEDEELWQE